MANSKRTAFGNDENRRVIFLALNSTISSIKLLSKGVFLYLQQVMNLFQFIPAFLRNKFLLATLAFGIWMIFFDKDDLLVQKERNSELHALQESKVYFQKEIEKERKFSQELKTNPAAIEKFAREKYMMTKEGEDLYIIEPTGDEKTKGEVAQ